MADHPVTLPAEVVATLPTSIAQQRAWFMEQIHPGNRGLNIAVRWELRGPVSSDAVERAFQAIIDRHEVLRTRFVERDGAPVQEVVAKVGFRLTRLDLRHMPEADHAARIREIALEHADTPFDLGQPGLIRVAMVRTAADRAALLIAVHNAVFDGYSIGVLGHELGALLAAMEAGRAPDLPELALHYGDYAQWQADYEASGGFDQAARYWTETLDGMAYFELPPDRPRQATAAESRSVARPLPDDLETRLGATAKALDTSVFALGTAAFAIALARFAGRRDVSFAVQAAGRNEVDLEPLIGLFTNPIVLRFDIDQALSAAAQAAQAREVVAGALAHQVMPFDKLVQVLNPPRDPLRIPLVSILFNLQRAFLREGRYGSVELVSVPSHSPGTLYDLNVNMIGRNAGWRLMIDYNARLYDAASIEALADLVVAALEALMAGSAAPISALPAPERDRVAAPAPVPEARPAPVGETKAALREIWAEVLAQPPERVQGDFFDLGGYSVLALKMLAEVGKRFGTRPSLAAFLADPTLDGLSGLIGAPESPAGAPAAQPIWELIELRAAPPTAPVLVTVNQPFLFQSLAGAMTAECAVVSLSVPDRAALSALEAAGLSGATTAALALLKARYGGRPLLFCGLCVDGRMALQIAQALDAEGEHIVHLAMIDAWAPGAIRAFRPGQIRRDRWRIRLRRLGYFLGLRQRGEIGWGEVLRRNDHAAQLLARVTGTPAKTEAEVLVDDTVAALVRLTKAHSFAPFAGEAALFVTRSQGMVPADGVLGWSGVLAPDTAVYPVNGWHGDALTRSGFERIIGVLDEKARRAGQR